MKVDTIVAGGLLALVAAYLLQRRLTAVLVWLALGVFVGNTALKLNHTMSVLFGVVVVYVVSMVTKGTYEGFENEGEEEEKEDPKKPKPAPPKTDDPHLDVGTTILHAYRNLTPEQIGGMRRDTKELLDLQKELMGSLAEMKPAIEQGAELLSTFSTFFGEQKAV
jgi:hypothetical protein